MASRRPLRVAATSVLLVGLCGLAPSGCARREVLRAPDIESTPRLSKLSYYEEGRELFLSVDVRAAKIGESPTFLPLQVVVLNKDLDRLTVTPESFILEGRDGRRVPLADYDDFEKNYRRDRVDRRLADEFQETLRSRFPEPPFRWIPLELYPERLSVASPRRRLDLRRGELAIGYIYFRLEGVAPFDDQGHYKLLFKPAGVDDTYVLDFRVNP